MSDQRCETCRHWSPGEASLEDTNTATPYETAKEIHVPTCRRITDHRQSYMPEKNDAYVADYEGYAAWLRTGPDFSCSLWEKK